MSDFVNTKLHMHLLDLNTIMGNNVFYLRPRLSRKAQNVAIVSHFGRQVAHPDLYVLNLLVQLVPITYNFCTK